MAHNESYRRILHKMRYYDYQHGLIYRYLNQGDGWNSHLEKCRSLILKALKIDSVKKVHLVDIIHPPEVINQVSKLHKVTIKEDDITGGLIEEVWKEIKSIPFYRKLKTLENIVIPEYKPEDDPGMVISLNILTQLETLPVKYLKNRSKADDNEFIRFRSDIQNKHISFLKKHKSVLISDVIETYTDNSGNVKDNQSVIIDLPNGQYKEEWTWDFDLKRSDYYRKRSVFKVVGIII
jgi:hypothetical protein